MLDATHFVNNLLDDYWFLEKDFFKSPFKNLFLVILSLDLFVLISILRSLFFSKMKCFFFIEFWKAWTLSTFLNFGFRGVVKLTSFFRISCVLYVSFKIESRVENTCYVPYIQPYFSKRVSMSTGTIFTKFFLNIFRQ